ncbi:MAG: hypothetical protein F4W92_01240 [Gammaproteobacteria bacterium]|nr:hypothetical protein [Gammaproteobacteria bacterium]
MCENERLQLETTDRDSRETIQFTRKDVILNVIADMSTFGVVRTCLGFTIGGFLVMLILGLMLDRWVDFSPELEPLRDAIYRAEKIGQDTSAMYHQLNTQHYVENNPWMFHVLWLAGLCGAVIGTWGGYEGEQHRIFRKIETREELAIPWMLRTSVKMYMLIGTKMLVFGIWVSLNIWLLRELLFTDDPFVFLLEQLP